MAPETHPSPDELAGYVHGTLPEDRVDSVAEHVETCVACEATVETLERQGDSLLEELRRPVTDATLQQLPLFGPKLLSLRVSTPSRLALQSRPGPSDVSQKSQAGEGAALERHPTTRRDKPALTAAGYVALLKLPDLVELQLDGDAGAPTDESLAQFAHVPLLRKLVLQYAESAHAYTAAGIAEFRRRRPDVQFIADGHDSPALVATPEDANDKISPVLVHPGAMGDRRSIVWQPDSRHLWITLDGHAAPLGVATGHVGPLEEFSDGNLMGTADAHFA